MITHDLYNDFSHRHLLVSRLFSKVSNEKEEIPEHRKKSLEKRDFDLIGAKISPVRHFRNNPGKMENVTDQTLKSKWILMWKCFCWRIKIAWLIKPNKVSYSELFEINHAQL